PMSLAPRVSCNHMPVIATAKRSPCVSLYNGEITESKRFPLRFCYSSFAHHVHSGSERSPAMAIATTNPTTGNIEQTFEAHSDEEVERRIALAQSGFEALRATSFAERAGWMRRAADILDESVEELASLITLEMGRPVAGARAEVTKSAKGLRFYPANAEGFLAGGQLDDPSIVGATSAGKTYAPLGVVLAVMPWNYPLWQVLRFAGPALMAGNAGLLKHASNVPQAALFL